MVYIAAIALFCPIIYLALKNKRWYLFLAVALIGVLPEQFSLSVHEKLPLLTVSRLLILLLAVFWVIGRIKEKKIAIPVPLLFFAVVNILVSVINLRYGFGEIRRLFLIIFERTLLVVMLKDLIKSKEEFDTCVDFFIMGSMVLAVIGIIQTVFDYDISAALRIRETASSILLSKRMGMTRAYSVFNAISYGCYCAFMVLPICYRLKKEGKLWHSLAFALNFAALICTFTRSAWLAVGAIALLLLLICRGSLLKKLLKGLGITVALLAVLCVLQPKLLSGLVETGKSSINTVLQVLPDSVFPSKGNYFSGSPTTSGDASDSTPEETQPQRPSLELSEDFGPNAKNPTASRIMQWTAVGKMIIDGESLFGYGYNALAREKLQFYYKNWGNKWTTTSFLDVGLIALIVEGGFVGAFSYLALLAYMMIYSLLQKIRQRNLRFDFYLLTLLVIPLYLLLNFLAAFLFYHAVWLYIGLFFAYQKIHTSPQLSSEAHP